jgi:hypothetical protein
MLVAQTELIGTNRDMPKGRPQEKFYVDAEMVAECEKIFDALGLNKSEGYSRLMNLLAQSPKSMWTILMQQQQDVDVVEIIAKYVLKHGPFSPPEGKPGLRRPAKRHPDTAGPRLGVIA